MPGRRMVQLSLPGFLTPIEIRPEALRQARQGRPMDFDHVPDFWSKREMARQRFYEREHRWPNQGETAAEMPCRWRTYQRWMQKARQTDTWSSEQQRVTEQSDARKRVG